MAKFAAIHNHAFNCIKTSLPLLCFRGLVERLYVGFFRLMKSRCLAKKKKKIAIA